MKDLSSFPLVTIVIPTYNRKELLQKAIASVISQTYTNWELFIVDDGSTDNTSQFVRSMNDARINIVELPHSGHIGSLFNIGVRSGTGEWLAFLASDDIWMSNKLELQLNALKKEGTRWCYSNFELMNELGKIIPAKAGKYRPLSGWIIKQLLTTVATVSMCSVMVQRSLFEEVNGFSADPRLLYRGDYELALRLAINAKVTALSDVLVRVLEHVGRTTNGLKDGYERTALAYEIFLNNKPEKELKYIAKRRRGTQLAKAASCKLGSGNYVIAFKLFANAIKGGAALQPLLVALYGGLKTRIKSLTAS